MTSGSPLRLLTTQDIFIYRELRLRALQESPTAFGASYEEEVNYARDEFAVRLQNPKDPMAGVVGAFGQGIAAPLIGMLGFGRDLRVKRAHSAYLWGMYVLPEQRGRGIGGALLDAVVAHVRSFGVIRHITLGVTASNEAASAFYQSRGFVRYGLEPDYLCINGAYHDMEYLMLEL